MNCSGGCRGCRFLTIDALVGVGSSNATVKPSAWVGAGDLFHWWSTAVPVGVLLVLVRDAEDHALGERRADELQADGQAVVGKSTRHGKRRVTAQIEWQRHVEIGIERGDFSRGHFHGRLAVTRGDRGCGRGR